MTNLARNLTDTTRAYAGQVAVRVDNAAMTYRALDEASARVAGLLHERGLGPGDRVGIMMPNVAEVPVAYYGVLRAGGVVVPMNPLLKAREVAYYLGDSGAGLIFAWHAFADQARGGAEQVEAELIVVDGVRFPDLLASALPDDQVADRGIRARADDVGARHLGIADEVAVGEFGALRVTGGAGCVEDHGGVLVFNPDRAGFVIHDAAGNSGSALFLFASENGAIDAWNPAVGATGPGPPAVTETLINNGANAVYKGLAIAQASDGHLLMSGLGGEPYGV